MDKHTPVNPVCSFYEHENQIHEVVFHVATPQAVDQWFEYVEQTNKSYQAPDVVFYIMDTSRSGDLPVRYTRERAERYEKENPNRPFARMVGLHNDATSGLMLNVLNLFVRWLQRNPKAKIRFFPVSKRDEAIQWLLSNKD